VRGVIPPLTQRPIRFHPLKSVGAAPIGKNVVTHFQPAIVSQSA
jgi:hypothetical protein